MSGLIFILSSVSCSRRLFTRLRNVNHCLGMSHSLSALNKLDLKNEEAAGSESIETDVHSKPSKPYSFASYDHLPTFSDSNNEHTEKETKIQPEKKRKRCSELVLKSTLPIPTMEKGRYVNPWPTWKPPQISSVLKWRLFDKNLSNVPSEQELDELLPILKPSFNEINRPPPTGIKVTWIGHATLLVQFDKISILTDPIFSDRASPVSFLGPKRYRKPPLTIDELPNIDIVVISHTHYDHLDLPSVIKLNQRFANINWFVGKGLAPWMQQAGCTFITELNWWEECIAPHHEDISCLFTPAQHWCKRTLNDDNKVLWGSWCVIGPWHRFFFAGDTGFCSVFPLIGDVCGPFDLAAIPIGAYAPRWFMKPQHIDPEEAVKIHIEIKAKKSVGIHWGTFNLGYEPYLEPPRKLRSHLVEYGIPLDNFFTMNHGETKLIEDMYRGLSMDSSCASSSFTCRSTK